MTMPPSARCQSSLWPSRHGGSTLRSPRRQRRPARTHRGPQRSAQANPGHPLGRLGGTARPPDLPWRDGAGRPFRKDGQAAPGARQGPRRRFGLDHVRSLFRSGSRADMPAPVVTADLTHTAERVGADW